ncbi:hypothetical protein [Nonomuraea typhae]|uniref:Fe/B12 periplasmic-binding domain-containing protein n=1 Tax=Nonomuraea typhae TaxID=2603600 RepID=A0ABW7YUF8_9ACTN
MTSSYGRRCRTPSKVSTTISDPGPNRAPCGNHPGKNGVSLENLDQLDADLLLVAFPFGDEGLLSTAELEGNKLFQSLGAVKRKHFAIIPSEDSLATSMAYPNALTSPWVVEKLTPILAKAAG